MFWHGHDTSARRELTELRAQLQALERAVADLHADVVRWQKRDRTRDARDAAGVTEDPPARTGSGPGTAPAASVKLTPARLRIMRRRMAESAVVNGAAAED